MQKFRETPQVFTGPYVSLFDPDGAETKVVGFRGSPTANSRARGPRRRGSTYLNLLHARRLRRPNLLGDQDT